MEPLCIFYVFETNESLCKSALHIFKTFNVLFKVWRPYNAVVFKQRSDISGKHTNKQLVVTRCETSQYGVCTLMRYINLYLILFYLKDDIHWLTELYTT